MAMTPWPIFKESESPRVAALIWDLVSAEISSSGTAITARSEAESVPFTAASTLLSSMKVTARVVAPSITWLLVTTRSSVSFWPTMMPEPLLGTSYVWVWPNQVLPWYSMVLVMATTEGITASTMGDTSSMNTPPEEVEVDWGAAWTTWVCWIGAVSSGNKALAARLTPNMVPPDTTPKRRAAAVTMAVVFMTERFFGALWLLPFSPWPPPFIPPFPSCPV